MADNTEIKFTSRKIKEGDNWSLIAYDEHGDANDLRDLLNDNPHLPIKGPLPVGETVYVRILDTPTTGKPVPPWFAEDPLNETLGETDSASVPVVEGPPVPLGFSPGYPKVEGNKLVFAINKSTKLPYSVQDEAGNVFAESSSYDFAAGFPVSTSDIQVGGRYRVKVGAVTSEYFTIVGAEAPLAFAQTPIVVKESGVFKLRYSLNKTGNYNTRVINTGTQAQVFNENNKPYTKNALVNVTMPAVGPYRLTVGTLSFDFRVQNEIVVKPDWLLAVVFNYDPNARELSKYVNVSNDPATGAGYDVEMNVSGNDAVGISWGNIAWNKNTWIPGTNIYADGYNEVFRINGTAFGVNGVAPGSVSKIRIRRTANPDDVFVYDFTAPSSPVNKQPIVFADPEEPEEPGEGVCERGPFIVTGSLTGEKGRLVFTFDAVNVSSFKYRIKAVGNETVLRSGVIQMLNENGTAKFQPSNRPFITYADLADGNYWLEIEGNNCTSAVNKAQYTIESDVIIIPPDEPDPEPGDPSLPSPSLYGTYEVTNGGRRLTQTGAKHFTLGLDSQGRITDTSSGIVHSINTSPSTRGGKNVFYMVRYRYLCNNGDGVQTFKSLKDIWFPDCIQTISRFECNPVTIPTYNAFVAGYGGYPTGSGVNKYNAELYQINFTLHTLANPTIPLWLVTSRILNFPAYVPNRPISKAVFAIESLNFGDDPATYHAKDVRTQTIMQENSPAQPYTFRTWKFGRDWQPGTPLFTDSELYNFLRGAINQYQLNQYSVITDEVPENAQGGDPNIGFRMVHTYRGAFELFQELFPGIKARDTGLFGPYGADSFYGTLDAGFIFKWPKAIVAEYLSTKRHHLYDINTGQWGGMVAYYSSEQYKYRNINIDYYLYFGARRYNLPLEMISTNERVKIGTIWAPDGSNHEKDWIAFTTPLSQTLMMAGPNDEMGPEVTRSADLIPFPGGQIACYASPGVAGEYWDLGFWSYFIGRRGLAQWDGGGAYGKDKTKINYYTPADRYIAWLPDGGGGEQEYTGAGEQPDNSTAGLKTEIYSAPVDASMAGFQAARSLDGYMDVLYYASYTSSRKSFTATPGQAGYHLNGFGPLNIGALASKDAADQKCAAAIIGAGSKGKCAVFNNGWLSCDEYEENVTLSYGGQSVTIPGKVYGGQTVYVKF